MLLSLFVLSLTFLLYQAFQRYIRKDTVIVSETHHNTLKRAFTPLPESQYSVRMIKMIGSLTTYDESHQPKLMAIVQLPNGSARTVQHEDFLGKENYQVVHITTNCIKLQLLHDEATPIIIPLSYDAL